MEIFLNKVKQYITNQISRQIINETDMQIIKGLDIANKIVEESIDKYINAYHCYNQFEEDKFQAKLKQIEEERVKNE